VGGYRLAEVATHSHKSKDLLVPGSGVRLPRVRHRPAHTTGSKHQIAAADAALGAAIFVPMANVKAGDMVSWAILKAGSGNVTGVSAVASNGGITFTFSADPQDDAIISYCVAAE